MVDNNYLIQVLVIIIKTLIRLEICNNKCLIGREKDGKVRA